MGIGIVTYAVIVLLLGGGCVTVSFKIAHNGLSRAVFVLGLVLAVIGAILIYPYIVLQ